MRQVDIVTTGTAEESNQPLTSIQRATSLSAAMIGLVAPEPLQQRKAAQFTVQERLNNYNN